MPKVLNVPMKCIGVLDCPLKEETVMEMLSVYKEITAGYQVG